MDELETFKIAHFQAEPANLLNEKAIEVLSPNDLIINCEKIILTNNGIEISIPKDLGGCKSIIINGIKFTREE